MSLIRFPICPMRKFLLSSAVVASTAFALPVLAQMTDTDDDMGTTGVSTSAGVSGTGTTIPSALPDTGGGWGAR